MAFINNQSSDRSTDGERPSGWLWGGVGGEEKKKRREKRKGRGDRPVGKVILRG